LLDNRDSFAYLECRNFNPENFKFTLRDTLEANLGESITTARRLEFISPPVTGVASFVNLRVLRG